MARWAIAYDLPACSPKQFLAGLFALSLLVLAGSAHAETRRAFLVGVQRYSDPRILQLTRTVTDAKDLGYDLEDVGFDHKDVTVIADPRSRESFDKDFDAFLKTVQPGDDVLFFFSGHGFGIEAEQTNYLLLGNLKSPYAYTQSQLPDRDRRNPDIVQLRVSSYIDAYQREEIPRSGISAKEIIDKIAARQPHIAIVILDACRSLLAPPPSEQGQPKPVSQGPTAGSHLLSSGQPPPGFMVLFSASFGEQAIERFNVFDHRRNSLFTEVVRQELQRPGQTLLQFAKRVRLVVRAIAEQRGLQQKPEYVFGGYDAESFKFIDSIGAERFQWTQDKCAGSKEDWEQIAKLRKRELYRRHLRRFDTCPTAELARRALSNLGLTSDDPVSVPPVDPRRPINDCDRLAASDLDPARPPEVPGVAFDKIDAEDAIVACNKAIDQNPRISRFLFNLGRAYQAQANEPGLDANKVAAAIRHARLNLNDASQRGYVSALNDLAVLDESGAGGEPNYDEASRMLREAAGQGLPIAMYNLGLHYQYGIGAIKQNLGQAVEWFSKAAESGLVSAMVERAAALQRRAETDSNRGDAKEDLARAVEWYRRAVDEGSVRARLDLGMLYYKGLHGDDHPGQALLWFGRAAAAGDATAEYLLARIMESGKGLAKPEPEIAERYWRLAADAGDSDAQIELAERLRDHRMLIKAQDDPREAVTLLQRAMSQGSPRAALDLARIYEKGQFGEKRDVVMAMKLAYHAIDLSVDADPRTPDGDPFYEIAAGQLLAAMAKSGEAVDNAGQPLLTEDEIDRLEHYYGKVDPVTRRVKVERLHVTIHCDAFPGFQYSDATIWIWDWGREEAPTEPQFRRIDRDTECSEHQLRGTMIAVFGEAKRNNVSFVDLLDQRIKSAQLQRALGRRRR
jgi:uncharacterized protein